MTTIDVSGWIFLLVPAQPGCPGQSPESRKTAVCVCVCMCACACVWKTAWAINTKIGTRMTVVWEIKRLPKPSRSHGCCRHYATAISVGLHVVWLLRFLAVVVCIMCWFWRVCDVMVVRLGLYHTYWFWQACRFCWLLLCTMSSMLTVCGMELHSPI